MRPTHSRVLSLILKIARRLQETPFALNVVRSDA